MNPATTSSASAQPGTMRGLTNDAAWIWCSPVSASASISLILSAVLIGPGSIWNPSRGPSSRMSTCVGRSVMILFLGENGMRSSASLRQLPQPVKPRRGAGEEIGFFGRRGAAREPLERVEQHRIAAPALVDRKIALEHAAVGAEIFDAGIDIGPPGIGHLTRRGRHRCQVEIEGVDDHRQPAELHIRVRAGG